MSRNFRPVRVRAVAGVAALMVTAALTGCMDNPGGTSTPTSNTAASTIAAPPATEETPMAPSPGSASSTSSGTPDTPSTGPEGSTPIVIDIDGETVTGRLDDGAASASLLAQLPLTVALSDFGGQEKVAELPEPLDLEGSPAGSGAEPGMIGYYVPDQRLILYYEQVGYYAGIVPLGTFDDAPTIEGLPDGTTVTLHAD